MAARKSKGKSKNPFRHTGKKANYERLRKGGSSHASAVRLVNTNPRWN